MEIQQLLQDARELQEQLISWRRDFHRHPELGFQEQRTASIVADYLQGLGLEVQTGIGGTGVTALLRGEQDGPTIALRADMDALPIEEATGVEYASRNPGVAHLCGHDAHTSILMGAARLLTGKYRPTRGNVKFIFQPAEEGLAGAAAMIRDGVLESPRVDAIAGLHVNPALPVGRFNVTKGVAYASVDTIELRIIGQGGHAARPHEAIDSIAVSAQVINAMHSMATRSIDPLETVVITIGKIEGGYMENVIAPEVRMRGTIRTLSASVRKQVPELLRRTIRGVTEAFGASFELTIHEGYPTVVNDDGLVAFFGETNELLFGEPRWEFVSPSTGGEDFAFYAERIPGVYFRLGTSNGDPATSYPLHHPKFNLEETALPLGSAMLAAIAIRYLDQS